MASSARDTRRRGKHAVNGSLAYDLDYAVREEELRRAGEAPKRRERVKEKIKSARRTLVRDRQTVSPLTLLSAAAIAGLCLVVLMNYVELTQLSSKVVDLQNELAGLVTENVSLTSQYQRMFDMASVKEATEAAGMAKPSSTQTGRLDLSAGDSAVAYRQKEPGLLSKILSLLHGGVYAVVEYFD